MRALEQPHRRNRGQNPGQLCHLWHVRLSKKCGAFRVETASEKIECNAAAVFSQSFRITQAGECVVIGDEIKRFSLSLQSDPGPHHAEVIADVQHTTGLNTRSEERRVGKEWRSRRA